MFSKKFKLKKIHIIVKQIYLEPNSTHYIQHIILLYILYIIYIIYYVHNVSFKYKTQQIIIIQLKQVRLGSPIILFYYIFSTKVKKKYSKLIFIHHKNIKLRITQYIHIVCCNTQVRNIDSITSTPSLS